ncbi:type I polyketide synthase [Nocardia sp. NBC_01499]|uniref:type I polyketide synthase n=1 Tax=Nocardia sp. NBC_01499 TaxID=2903597 RepID=UPI0038660767
MTGSATAPGSEFPGRVAAAAPADRYAICLDLVLAETAALLGCAPNEVVPDRAYRDYGYNSLAGLALTEQLSRASGIELPLTMLFDQPSPAAVAEYLLSLAQPESAATEPAPVSARTQELDPADAIAVVGMACRFPGGVSSPEQLWQLVAEGRDAIGEFPDDRGWDLENLYHPDPAHLGTSYSRAGGFLPEVTQFDPQFFGISPHDAVAMDPQQRLLLEGSWELFEHAGIDPATLRGSATGVFLGVCGSDYSYLTRPPAAGLEGRWGLGMMGSVASGRVAYTFGFVGPALTLDTACSSSLVSIHLAMQSLRRGETTLAIAGGAQVLATPSLFIEFSRQRGLAPDGRCKSFAEGADGTGFSEGMGLVLLERLSDAQHNNHHIHAILPGSAINSDGASNGLTAPNGPSQERVIHAALTNANLTTTDIDAIEAHGTGTTLGDPIEANALHNTYGTNRPTHQPLWLGSIKSNIGHTQAAAGASGLIKTIMALHHNTLPQTLHIDTPTTKINWTTSPLQLLTQPQPWPPHPNGTPRRAAISAFGVSGTNAHLIIQEPPPTQNTPTTPPDNTPTTWTLSARTPHALTTKAHQLHTWLTNNPHHHPTHLAHTLATTRTHHEHRAAITATTTTQLHTALTTLAQGETSGSVVTGRIRLDGRTSLAVMFPGQGSQYAGMGTELARQYPVFAAAWQEVCAELDRHLDRPLDEIIAGSADSADAQGLLDQTGYTQAALFAIEVALYRLLESFGVRPAYLIGHSVGELTAAHVSGALDLPDACLLVASRARLMQALPPGGAMVAVQATEDELAADLAGVEERVSIAAVNGPSSVVISGVQDEVVAIAERWSARGRRTKRLTVSHAFHSPLMEPMLADFADLAAKITLGTPRIPIVSNATGRPVEDFGTPEYWVRHARGAVRFGAGIGWLADAGVDTFLEVGPGGALSVLARESLSDSGQSAVIAPTMRPRRSEGLVLQTALARAYVSGLFVDWGAVSGDSAPERIDLPTYPFERQRYWVDTESSAAASVSGGITTVRHPLFDGSIELAGGGGRLYLGNWSAATRPWLTDHTVFGTTVVAGAAIVEFAADLGGQSGLPVVAELTLEAPLLVPSDRAVAVQVHIDAPDASRRSTFTVHSSVGDEWIRNASGTLAAAAAPEGQRPATSKAQSPAAPKTQWPPDDAVAVDIADLYPRLAEQGLGYGPQFQRLQAVWRHNDDIYATIERDTDADDFALHPGMLDAAFHAAFLEQPEAEPGTVWLPFAWSGVRVQPAARAAKTLRIRLTTAGANSVRMTAIDEAGELAVSVDSVVARPVSLTQLSAARSRMSDSLFRWNWTGIDVPSDAAERPAITMLGDAEAGHRYADLAVLLADIDAGAPTPTVVVVDPATDIGTTVDIDTAEDVPAETANITNHVRQLIQKWLSDTRFGTARLAITTRNAVAVRDGEIPDPRLAAVWGLVRSAQTEHPDRFALFDFDAEVTVDAVARAASTGAPQLAVRGDELLVPRLQPMRVPSGPSLWRELAGSVLITGGTSGLGALVARHLVAEHGVRRLILVSRRGSTTEGASELLAELTEQGADVEIAACDVADRDQVAGLLAKVRADHRLRAVVHAAGVTADGVIDALTAGQLHRVLRPKVDAAWHLHELTADLELAAFVLFSSAAGAIGAPGQANYAAANTFLDALATWRRARGLAAVSMAWGLWEQPSAMTEALTDLDKARLGGGGVLELTEHDGLRLFDAATNSVDPVVFPVRLDPAALRTAATAGLLPAVLSDLAPAPQAATAATGVSLADRLAGLPEPEREQEVLQLVCVEVANVLHYPSPDAVDPERAFTDIGFDSLGALELRNRLSFESGLTIPITVVFDHPNAEAIARYVNEQLFGSAAPTQDPASSEAAPTDALDTMDAESLIRLALSED